MRQMDENFDGRISYKELREHIKSQGFSMGLENDHQVSTKIKGKKVETFVWRDKGIELVIRTLNIHLNKKPFEEYFKKFDSDHDNHLTPNEFRQSLLSVKDVQLKKFQIERIMHVLIDEKKSKPVISISKIAKFLKNYQYIDKESIEKGNSTAILIDEDLFVYIVEKYDGFSRLVELISQFEEKSSYLQRHVFEINLRGLNMLSNQKTVEKLHKKAVKLNELFESSLILLAGEANRLMKEEAQLCVLDPSHNINIITNDQNAGVLSSIQVPTIENSAFDIDFATLNYLPSGAQRYLGIMSDSSRKRVEVLIFPNDDLNYVSSDGKTYKKHLQLELQVHRYLMGQQFEDDEEELDINNMDIFPNVGKFEKKIGLAASDKEIYVVNELVDEDEWISLEEFVERNGGILNIPLFYHTDAPLFIIRYWAQKLLQIIQKLHVVSIVTRSLNLKQVFISRDGQRMKLGHLRGVGKVNNLGNIKECPDIYLTLENNSIDDRYNGGQSSTISPGQGGAMSSSKKTEAQKSFSNRALDNPFIAPEILFSKFTEHTSALDVWSFGMIMYCVLLGQKPASFYNIYRTWYKSKHGHDIELASLPFIPPSQSNFLYDPFSVNFDNPFNTEESELNKDLDIPGSLMEKKSSLNFENVMKCIKNLSCSSLFEDGNSKKFQFKNIAQDIKDNNNPNMMSDQPPRFPGQSHSNQELRRKVFQAFAKSEVLERKNELGLILDLIASCLDMDPKKRPTIQGMMNSPLFKLDNYEMTNAIRFSQNVILYRSPQSSVSLRITAPLRSMCAIAIKSPSMLFNIEADILKLFMQTEECIGHISSLPIDQINSVLTENEKRKSLINSNIQSQFKGKDFSYLRVSPNSPLAAQIIEDRVIDMLIFLTLRYTKTFNEWKTKKLTEIGKDTQSIMKQQQSATQSLSSKRKSVKFEGDQTTDRASQYQAMNQTNLQKKQTERLQNMILSKMTNLLRTLVYEMHSYNTPMAPFVKEVIEYIVKFYAGEEHELGSDFVLRKTSGMDSTIKDYLRGRSFCRRENELDDKFKSDNTDKQWHTEQKNKTFLDKSNYWNTELHQEALKIYKDAITESGMGQSCYPVINDYITNITNSFEPSKVFSHQMNQLCLSFLIPMNRTALYYNELIPLTECLARLYSPELEKAGKRCALAVIRSVFQTGSSDKIKACLDMRIPKHIIHFLQDSDSEVRHECLLIFYEISKGLQDDDFEILGKSAANLKQELSKRAHRRTAFDAHKTLSLVSQQEEISKKEDKDSKKKRGQSQQSQADIMSNYIKRTTALIEKNENEKYINFALDLPNLNFLSNKRFLREMAICFESPVFVAPLIRLLKSQTESYQNKDTILKIISNLFCGSEKVMIAINSPACDTYMTLLRMLMQNSKIQSAKMSSTGLSAQMRQLLVLQEKVVELFRYMFEQRRPTIIRDLSCIGASSTLLKEQGLYIPSLINLPEIVAFVDEFNQRDDLTADMIIIEDFLSVLKDLRCWIKHFYQESQIPELTRIKALQRCINLIVRVIRLLWQDYPQQQEKKADYLIFIKAGLQLIDWLCVRGQEHFIFNEQNGKYNIEFVIEKCNYALSAFRHPESTSSIPMEELAHNSKNNKESQKHRKYDMFPFTEIGAILQNILYQLVRKNAPFTNQLLAEADYGFVFGEQLILEYDFIRHCIDNKIESMVLIDTYVKKNEIRLNTYEYLLGNSEHTLKHQFIKSNFIEKLFYDYIQDFREFNIQFSKIDLEFLAFRKTFPIRLEGISIINTTLLQKQRAPGIFTEVIMYARRHFLIRNEVTLLRQGRVSTEESTSLLLFSIILESNEEDLVYAMMQEGAHKVIKDMMKEYPSLNKKFPILASFTNKF